MKCPHCGADSTGKFCEYCGSELPYSGPQVQNTYQHENVTHNVTNIYYVNSTEPVQQYLPEDFPPAKPVQSAAAQPVYQPQPIISEPGVSPKNRTAALLLCIFLGYFGVHLFYVGRWKKGLVYLFTLGIFGFGWLIDMFVIAANRFKDAQERPLVGKSKWVWFLVFISLALFMAIASQNSSGY